MLNRNLCRRLERLERSIALESPDLALTIVLPLPDENGKPLAPGERIVLDYYHLSNLLVQAAERMTSDPKDEGHHCAPRLCEMGLGAGCRGCYWANTANDWKND